MQAKHVAVTAMSFLHVVPENFLETLKKRGQNGRKKGKFPYFFHPLLHEHMVKLISMHLVPVILKQTTFMCFS